MARSSLGHIFTVSSVSVTVDTPCRLNIKKRRENVVTRTLTTGDNINIAYYVGRDITPASNLFLSDKSNSLVQNRIPTVHRVFTTTGNTLTLNIDKFLVTDQYTTDIPSRPLTPLFYKHQLQNFTGAVGQTLTSLEFIDRDLRSLTLNEYLTDSVGTLYNNIENWYDASTGDFSVAYVKYTVREVAGAIVTTTVYHELISNQPIFEQAGFDDLDDFGVIISGRKKYLIEELPGGQAFLVTLPIATRYSYMEVPESRLRLLPPTALNIEMPWYMRVTNGRFLTSLRTTNTTWVNHKYHVAEFDSQVYNPYPPYKYQGDQVATWLSPNLILVPKNIVNGSDLNLYTEIVVKDKLDAVKYAITDNPSKLGLLYSGSVYWTDSILSMDCRNGFIELDLPVRDDDEIIVSYFTEENEYEFTSINFNPANNLDILNERIVFYVVPETYATGELSRTLYYLKVNTLGEITYSSQAEENFGLLSDPSTTMLMENFNETGLPIGTIYYDRESTASGLNSWVASGMNIDSLRDFSFVDKYTVDSVLFRTTTTPSGYAYENYKVNPRLLVLGEVQVGESQTPESISPIDVRVNGGGIKKGQELTALEQQPEVGWYLDMIGNRSYPSVGAFVVEVPQSVLTDFGGRFTRDQLDDVIYKHMKAGGYAIVKTYGIDPVITSLTVGSGLIEIGWPSYGSGLDYNVHKSLSINSGFSTANESLIHDIGSANTCSISGLITNTKYYIKVSAITVDNETSYGTTISATTTS